MLKVENVPPVKKEGGGREHGKENSVSQRQAFQGKKQE